MHAVRDKGYYRVTAYLPLVFIALMAWLVFWIDPAALPSQIGLSTASVFSLIAFRYSLRLGLPPVSYMTRLETYVLGCTVLVFLALGQAVLVGRLARLGHEATAKTLTRWGRWIYLAGLIGLTAAYI